MAIGKRQIRVDAVDKVLGRAKYTEDMLCENALVARILHAKIAHGYVKSIDASEALKIPGVVRVFTGFDVPDHPFPTAGHPWSMDPAHQDVADRFLLVKHVKFYGDDVAVVVAENDVAADQGVRALKVEYEELPFVLDVQEAMQDDAPQLHEAYKNNILGHSTIRMGNYEEAIKEPGLIKVEGWYDAPHVQHCHIENPVSFAYMEAGKMVVVASTQIPHIVRRVVGQAIGIPWGSVRLVKPYIGGGFGNKQDALYEPLNAWVSYMMGGRLVKLIISREETFYATRTRHAIKTHIISYVRPDGSFAARKVEMYSDQGAYASHGHGIAAKGLGAFPQLYPCDNIEGDAWTVFTNKPVAGAMRGYGIPQAMLTGESHIDDIATTLGIDPLEYRQRFVMPKGYVDDFSKNVNYDDSFGECLEKGMEHFRYKEKLAEYADQTGDVRRGVGVAVFWYNTGVWPISLETSACRMVLHQDGSIQLQMGETEIGQGADTTFSQMAAETVGVPFEHIHITSTQDTDVTPFGTGAYASRQTYMGGFAIRQTALILKEKILKHAQELTRFPAYTLDIVAGNIVRKETGEVLMSLGHLAATVLYSMEHSEHITAESTYQCKSNAYSFGCSFAEVEVDIPMCQAKLISLTNVHDCGTLINPALAEGQVHGGMSMAIGYGLQEKMLFDEKTGRMLNDNLLDYKLCTPMDHPDLTALFVENHEPTSAYGTKSLGEPPTCSGAPAIRNAILNATGVAVNEAPFTPHVLFKAFSEAGLIGKKERVSANRGA